MRARILLTGVMLLAAACSRPAADTAVDEALDARNEDPNLALTVPSDEVPVTSDVEVGKPPPADEPSPQRYTVAETHAPPSPEPLVADQDGEMDAGAVAATVPVPVGRNAGEALSESVEEGGGKPAGVSTGLGPVPEPGWADPVIIDDPGPVPGMTGTIGPIGREGVVIIRGGAGGMHDDCKAHAGGGAVADASPTGAPAVLVNDRDPRRGALINERAPRTARSPSLPRGGGFVRGGIR